MVDIESDWELKIFCSDQRLKFNSMNDPMASIDPDQDKAWSLIFLMRSHASKCDLTANNSRCGLDMFWGILGLCFLSEKEKKSSIKGGVWE